MRLTDKIGAVLLAAGLVLAAVPALAHTDEPICKNIDSGVRVDCETGSPLIRPQARPW